MSDLIDRRAALDALRKMQTYKLFSGDDMLLIDQAGAQTELMLLPPIQPKRGRWERGFDGNHAVCSNCEAWWIPFGEGYKTDYHFCPNCGAKMEGVSNES